MSYNPDFDENYDFLQNKPKSSYPKNVTDELNRLRYDVKHDNITPFGSYLFRYQKYYGDYDNIEYIEGNNKNILVKKFVNRMKQIVKNILKTPNHYYSEVKAGYDPVYQFSVGYLCNGIYYVDNDFLPRIQDLYQKGQFDKKDYDQVMKLITGNQLNQDIYDLIIKIMRSYFILRWEAKDILSGKIKAKSGNIYTLEKAVTEKTLCKIDEIVLIDNNYIEVTNIYELAYVDKDKNIINLTPIFKANVIPLDIEKLWYSDINFDPLKCLKRIYSYCNYQIKNNISDKEALTQIVNKIVPFLSSNISNLHRQKTYLYNIQLLLSLSYKIPISTIKKSLDNVKQSIANILEIDQENLINDNNIINKLMNKKSYKEDDFNMLIDYFKTIINKYCIKFVNITWSHGLPNIVLPNNDTIEQRNPLSDLISKQCLISYNRNIMRKSNDEVIGGIKRMRKRSLMSKKQEEMENRYLNKLLLGQRRQELESHVSIPNISKKCLSSYNGGIRGIPKKALISRDDEEEMTKRYLNQLLLGQRKQELESHVSIPNISKKILGHLINNPNYLEQPSLPPPPPPYIIPPPVYEKPEIEQPIFRPPPSHEIEKEHILRPPPKEKSFFDKFLENYDKLNGINENIGELYDIGKNAYNTYNQPSKIAHFFEPEPEPSRIAHFFEDEGEIPPPPSRIPYPPNRIPQPPSRIPQPSSRRVLPKLPQRVPTQPPMFDPYANPPNYPPPMFDPYANPPNYPPPDFPSSPSRIAHFFEDEEEQPAVRHRRSLPMPPPPSRIVRNPVDALRDELIEAQRKQNLREGREAYKAIREQERRDYERNVLEPQRRQNLENLKLDELRNELIEEQRKQKLREGREEYKLMREQERKDYKARQDLIKGNIIIKPPPVIGHLKELPEPKGFGRKRKGKRGGYEIYEDNIFQGKNLYSNIYDEIELQKLVHRNIQKRNSEIGNYLYDRNVLSGREPVTRELDILRNYDVATDPLPKNVRGKGRKTLPRKTIKKRKY